MDLAREDLNSSFNSAPAVSPWENNAPVLLSLCFVNSKMEVVMPSISSDCLEGQMMFCE